MTLRAATTLSNCIYFISTNQNESVTKLLTRERSSKINEGRPPWHQQRDSIKTYIKKRRKRRKGQTIHPSMQPASELKRASTGPVGRKRKTVARRWEDGGGCAGAGLLFCPLCTLQYYLSTFRFSLRISAASKL
jgi:hypothetical protein